ncbi:MAG: tRNA (N(6)-L-threonylcarbamoyladenosine(37)-C(2))-methylthiotransferase MtaB [Gammaproteobacteria bacterium]|nr:tRNA (N(6)-L-threonylcarbamoyladenosine(37)-C(2))-methylthiotransferase MtaB [Gammaproteobacteria bacterium]
MQVYLKAIGCRLNEAEIESWAAEFQRNGHSIASAPQYADLMVFNSCAVTGEAARKSRQQVRRLHRENRMAKLVMTGCYATLENARVATELGVDLVVNNAGKEQLVQRVERELAPSALSIAAAQPGEAALFARGRQRAFVKIQDGCRYRCTYCIVTLARGDERSRGIADIVNEINCLTLQGVHEVVLTGVHVGGYGSDTDSDLAGLVQAVLADTDLPRLRLASVEPWDLPATFFHLFENPRLMPHLHLPMQSGSDSVLRRMSRRCKTDDFKMLISEARRVVADFNVTTDIIVGFPGESDSEWRETLHFAERLRFGHIHVFTYSPRTGTKATTLPGQLDKRIKKQRSSELHVLAARHKRETLAAYVGRELPVLWEGDGELLDGGKRRFSGYTPNMLRVVTDAAQGESLTNRICMTRIDSLAEHGERLSGTLVG